MLRELFGYTKPDNTALHQAKSVSTASVLGANTQFEGTLKSAGDVHLDGEFVGDITAQGKVTIGEQGKLEGGLTGEAVAVGGIVRGDITARKVAISQTGRVWGNLRLETLMTEEGGFIQGLVTMEESVDLSEIVGQPTLDEATPAGEALEEKRKDPEEKAPVEVTTKK